VAEKQAAADKAQKEIDSDIAALAKLREEEKALELKAKAAREAVRKAELELAAAKSEAEKSTRQLAADKERVDKLRAEYREMRGLPPEPVKSAAL
jgi:predicted  nucleic acid-binding Zn-ribbon protein